jgi:hypothetical protein
MVASTQTLIILSISSIFIAIALFTVLAEAFLVHSIWPSMLALKNLESNANMDRVLFWVECLRESYALKNDSYTQPVEVFDINRFEDAIINLRNCWVDAKLHGSIFELIIGDVLDDLILRHSYLYPIALRKYSYWDETYETSGRDIFNSKRQQYSLMNSKKRRILYKILAMKAIIGNRNIKSKNMSLEDDDDEEEDMGTSTPSDNATLALLPKLDSLKVLINRTEDYFRRIKVSSAVDRDLLIGLYNEWDSFIDECEDKLELFTSNQIEEWYTYRNLLNEKIINISTNDIGYSYSSKSL